MNRLSRIWIAAMLCACNPQGNKDNGSPVFTDSISTGTVTKSTAVKARNPGFCNDWIITGGSLTTDTLRLSFFDSAKYDFGEVLTFRPDGRIRYWVYKPRPRCGNGILRLDGWASTWTVNPAGTFLILQLDGSYSLDYEFKKKSAYEVDSSNTDQLILVWTKTYYDLKKRMGDKDFK